MDAKTLAEQHPHMRDADMPIAERIKAATERIASGHASMRVPVEGTDPDIVLHDCRVLIERQAAELEALRTERDALKAERAIIPPELCSNMRTPDGGPRFRVGLDGCAIEDDDFIFDAMLRITGDFPEGTRETYAQWIADTLNRAARTGGGRKNCTDCPGCPAERCIKGRAGGGK